MQTEYKIEKGLHFCLCSWDYNK